MAPALFGFGVGFAMERERGWLTLKRVHADAARRVSAGEDGDGDAVRGDHLLSCSR